MTAIQNFMRNGIPAGERANSRTQTSATSGGVPQKPKRGKRRGPATWKKECACLMSHEQTWPPTTEERMELARVGLGLIQFGVEDSAAQIHEMFLSKYPPLEAAGGYSLLRCSDSSRILVEIETPEGGLTIPYLKDIVRQAKLYIRPLQCDIQASDVKPTTILVRASIVDNKSLQTMCFQNCELLFTEPVFRPLELFLGSILP